MRFKPFIALAAAFLLSVILAGCGGGGQEESQQAGNDQGGQEESRQTDQSTTGGEQTGEQQTSGAGARESVRGVVVKTDMESRGLIVKPADDKATRFKFNPDNIKVMIDGERGQPEDIRKGQRGKLNYTVVTSEEAETDLKVVRSVVLRSKGAGSAGGQTTG